MKILKINIKNLNSLRLQTEIDFAAPPLSQTGLFAITGDTGAGKTTILDAVTLALYKKTPRNREDEVMTYGTTDCFAEVEFEVKGKQYRSRYTRRRAHGKTTGNLQTPNMELAEIEEGVEEGNIIASTLKSVPQKVAEITGLNYEQFCRSVMLAQGEFAAFLNAESKKRGELLEQITGTHIYGELSKAAHQKARTEKQKLEDLDKDLAAFQLLNNLEIKELKAELKTFEKEAKGLKKDRDKFRKQLDWLSKIQNLTKQKSENEAKLAEYETQKSERAGDFEKLELHEKTIPFQADLRTLDNSILSQKELLKEIENRQVSEANLTAESAENDSKFRAVQTELSNLKKAQTEKEKLYRKVENLDLKISEKENPILQIREDLEEHEKAKTEADSNHEKLENRKTDLSARLTENEKYLTENKILEGLEKDMPKIEQLRESGLKSHYAKKELEGEISKFQSQFQTALTDFEKREKQLKKTESQREKLLSEFKNLTPEYFVESRNELLTNLQNDIEKLDSGAQKLGRLKELSEQYETLLEKLNSRKAEVENLAREGSYLSMELLSMDDFREELRTQFEYRKNLYEQQQRIANYEAHRAELADGEPCPLCGSEAHPFCENSEFKPYVNETKKDFEKVKIQLEKTDKKHSELVARSRELFQATDRFYGKNEKNGELQEIDNQIITIENKISDIGRDFEFGEFGLARKEGLKSLISEVENRLIGQREIRSKLTDLNLKIELTEKDWAKVKEEVSEAKEEVRKFENQLQNAIEKKEEKDREIANSKADLKLILEKYGREVKSGSTDRLKADFEVFKLKKEEKSKLENQIAVLKTEIKASEKSRSVLSKQINKITANLNQISKGLEELKTQRFELFEDKNPETERANSEKILVEKEMVYTHLNQVREDLNLKLKEVESALKESEKRLKKVNSDIEKGALKLEKKISKKGFESLEQLRNSVLNQTQINQIQNTKNRLNELIIKTKERFFSAETTLKKESKKALTDKSAEELNLAFQKTESDFQTLQQKIGGIKTRFEENDKRKENQGELLEKRNAQNAEFLRWEKLRSIIGSHDGKEYRSFAQGLTLQRLVQLANRHLSNLSGRYVIQKEEQKDLDLQIIDTYQADNIRSMNTLSGGESFLVSLALALGLSDLAGRNTNIRSLFIDEGFGTLDEATLDEAVSTLENLQASGKTIGVISHVKELKERISTQIRVIRKSGGFSELEVV